MHYSTLPCRARPTATERQRDGAQSALRRRLAIEFDSRSERRRGCVEP